MRFRIMLGSTVLIAAVVFAACGGDDDDAGDAGGNETPAATEDNGGGSETSAATDDGASDAGGGEAIDACELVTQDEAEGALGASVGEGERQDIPPFYGCSYETDSVDQLTVSVVVFPSSDDAEAAYELVIDMNDYPTIDGLGDRAYDTQPIGDVTVQKGKYELSVDILTEDNEADFAAAKDLAKTALGRLP
jgi:hypothetical protein